MRLSKIKLAGFKSFVDPTTLEFPGNLLAVVGPNGCGKSNVIDAVRWVMGESSAKTLRGDSLADVIFNGSTSRKPVGTATIELIFDNSDGAIGGPYANYNEVSIKRLLSRDGTSQYFLNNTRCRRKDIKSIFLGTGLGPRSYAIIEQGMISRLIEARPEDLRVYLEEAAGISKYKERRRETENRMRHTRDNLDRLNDLREEVEAQLKHLQRQASVAERYKTYKDEQRRSAAELLVLRMRELQAGMAAERQKQMECETALEAAISQQRSIEADIEKARERQAGNTDAANAVQERFYTTGAEIARLEQQIQHSREMRKRHEDDLVQTRSGLEELDVLINRDSGELKDLEGTLGLLEPDLQRAREAEYGSAAGLQQAESAMQAWQQSWDEHAEKRNAAQQTLEVEQARIEHREQALRDYRNRSEQLQTQREELSVAALKEQISGISREESAKRVMLEGLHSGLASIITEVDGLRDEDKRLAARLDESRVELHQLQGRLASLEALQQAALGENKKAVMRWLEGSTFAGQQRLGQVLSVEPGWERAVETVLGDYLEAICIDGMDAVEAVLGELPDFSLGFVVTGKPGKSGWFKAGEPLATKVSGDIRVDSLMSQVFAADSLSEALGMRSRLGAGESVITRDGVWIGADWLRVSRDEEAHAGVLSREDEIRRLRLRCDTLQREVSELGEKHDAARNRITALDKKRDLAQVEVNQVGSVHASLRAKLEERQERLEHQTRTIDSLASEAGSVGEQVREIEEALRQSRILVDETRRQLANLEEQKHELVAQRISLTEKLAQARDAAREDRERTQQLAIEVESRRSTQQTASGSIERMRRQQEQLQQRIVELGQQIEASVAPQAANDEQLQALLQSRIAIEKELGDARSKLESVEDELRKLDETRLQQEQEVQRHRDALNEVRLSGQEVRVRHETVAEQFAETAFDLETMQGELPEDAAAADWEQRLEKLDARISRLGAINLAAIDEYREQSERKEYLDSQHDDLNEALETLERAIRKIDKETRARFRETFEQVDAEFRRLFPRLFGGGTAFLELTGDDLLNSGVTVMARPPGKRNSTIHL
ncbi:MAG: chromosome segregation protein SMC, partial [Gammaproteobacteria bacterium]|nr:chromosome segregation protein SMC [Gammaproteobacteria bacterium]